MRRYPSAVTAPLDESDEPAPPAPHDGSAVDEDSYNLEATVRIAADDDFELPNHKLGYRIKQLRNGRSKLRIMAPIELLARLAALIPPPRHPLVRFHGAFAPRLVATPRHCAEAPAPVPKRKHDHESKSPTSFAHALSLAPRSRRPGPSRR